MEREGEKKQEQKEKEEEGRKKGRGGENTKKQAISKDDEGVSIRSCLLILLSLYLLFPLTLFFAFLYRSFPSLWLCLSQH